MERMKKMFKLESPGDKPGLLGKTTNIVLVGLFIAGIFLAALLSLGYKFDWTVIWTYRFKILQGYGTTFLLAGISIFISIFIGIISASGLQSRILFFRYLARTYVEVIRGTPFLVQIIFFYFIIAPAVGLNNKFVIGVLILSIFTGAYVTEIIRGGIQSIPETQWITSRSLGFSPLQTYRYIVFPQVFRRILPALAGQMSSLVKDSSLLSVIAVAEFTKSVREVESITYRAFEVYTFLMLGYLLITIPISLLSKWLERKYYYES
ncbi:MAG TPA: amino acid ABC transporter permease, partial [Clostridia bacterium]|nr:amino acid ABC transporter permease [Clostridia bacterium]